MLQLLPLKLILVLLALVLMLVLLLVILLVLLLVLLLVYPAFRLGQEQQTYRLHRRPFLIFCGFGTPYNSKNGVFLFAAQQKSLFLPYRKAVKTISFLLNFGTKKIQNPSRTSNDTLVLVHFYSFLILNYQRLPVAPVNITFRYKQRNIFFLSSNYEAVWS